MNDLNTKEIEEYLCNRTKLYAELCDIQYDLRNLTDVQLIQNKDVIMKRLDRCLKLLVNE